MLDAKIIGSRIKALRKQRGLTQSTFAEDLHVSFQAVSNWERGIAPPELENIILIASYFGILVDDLLRPDGESLFLGIDGGGTKSEFVVVNAKGHVFDRFLRSGCNPNDIGFQNAFDIISSGIRDALIRFPRIITAFCGIAGVTVGNHCSRMIELLKKKYPSLNLQIRSDSANLFGMDESFNMAVICGTGSVVFVKQGERFIRLGGWGYLLDNAGSAYDIGRDAVASALAEEDSLEPPSPLSLLLREKLDSPRIFDTIHKLYGGGKPYIASLAPLVFQACSMGDRKAIAIIDKTAARIGELLELGIRLYNVRPKVVASGGIFEHYTEIFLPHVAKYTDAEIHVCGLPPVCGACRLSLGLANTGVPAAFNETFQKTYEVCCNETSEN